MITRVLKIGMLSVALIMSATVQASERNDIPSCSSMIPSEYYSLEKNRSITIIVDKTMANTLDNSIKTELFENIKRFIKQGDIIEVIDFSSYSGSSYTKVSFKGQLDTSLDDDNRNYIKKSVLRKYDRCLKEQHIYAIKKLAKTMSNSFKPEEKSSNTELIGTLRDVSTQLLAGSHVKKKVVVLISDMLEHSDTMSFYSSNRIRQIDASKELAKIEQKGLLSNFANSNIYIVGAGTLPQKYKSQYVSSKKMDALEKFWTGYFEKSNGRVKEFGKPMLLTDIQ
ncbi:hypothetical protein I3271_09180 [Photobacterium leiognathi]|uniref:hypothetical protein n=1 Tax=Photobacterium leiognathi TaxID=553611 RepID=UPI001EDDBD78|nr:hypothetical protein [Photobacterium leiognathi]MCG3884861.1 hypothetical protein [Photobacterium leiognathi]